MAAQITHILAGEEALVRAEPHAAPRILDKAGSYFRLGCQGPDIFYHNQRTKPSALHYGALAHRRDYGTLVAEAFASLPEARRKPDSPSGAYILGLATHAAIDRATHPFIVYFSGWADPAVPGSERYRGCHSFFERLLDLCYLEKARKLRGVDYDVEAALSPLCFGSAKGIAATGVSELVQRTRAEIEATEAASIEAAAADEELIALWAAGLRAAFPRSAGGDFLIERRIANALLDARYFYAITNPVVTALNKAREDWFAYLDDRAGARSMALVYPDDLPQGVDFMNEAKAEWDHPAGEGRSSRASYLDLVEAGIEDATAALRVILVAMKARGPKLSQKVEGGSAARGTSRGTAHGERDDDAISELIGNGGLSICGFDGLPLPPKLSRPLALQELMEAEFRQRLAWARRLLDPSIEGSHH